ncbi:unnamed protein product, partial [Scytosiphon promiscuus]
VRQPGGETCSRQTRRGKDDEAVVELEEEAESMRVAVVASHARLLGRVRELQGVLKGRRGGQGAREHALNFASATTCQYSLDPATAAGAAAVRGARAGREPSAVTAVMRDRFDGGSGSGSDSGAVDSAEAVVSAREELGELRAAVEAARDELARERQRARTAQEHTSRLESLRSSAAAAASSARRDSDKARGEAERLARDALEAARERETEESQLRRRLASLRTEAARELEAQR